MFESKNMIGQSVEDSTGLMDTLNVSISSFLRWLHHHGIASHDPYDLWSTTYGKFVRRLYYRNRILGVLLVVPILGIDLLFPRAARLFLKKKIYPIANAQLIIGYINLYETTANEEYLVLAKNLAAELEKSSISGYSGNAWGYPFDWQSVIGAIPKDTPLITTIPYCYEAFARLHGVTNDKKLLDILHSIANFVANDLHDTYLSGTASACSYTPLDKSMVVNANAYRSALLLDAFERFGDERWKKKAIRNLQFVLGKQHQDGSWFYEPGRQHNEFVDNIHTSFVLKNLCKINEHMRAPDIGRAIQKGYGFYRENLFDTHDMPKPYAHVRRISLVKTECYDFAEGIYLGVVLNDAIPGALEFAMRLAHIACDSFQMPEGNFTNRVYVWGGRNSVPYLRWPQAPMFLALTSLFKRMSEK